MAVPEHIRKVTRPRNTVVIDSGSKGAKRFAVHARLTSVYKSGSNPKPRNGRVIGHIINGKYVPRIEDGKIAANGPDYLSYGLTALIYDGLHNLDTELFRVYDVKDVGKSGLFLFL